MEVTVFVTAEIYPTETADNVKTAVDNVLGNAQITIKSDVKGSILTAIAKGQDSLIKLRSILRNDRIRDASRRLLFKSIRNNMLSFCLNKQVAFAGHVSFSEETMESPLGPIRFSIEAEHPQQLVEWLAERT